MGVEKLLALQAGVLVQQLFAPFLAQVGAARGRRVGQRLARGQVVEVVHYRRQEHGLAVFAGDADRGVVTLGLVLGFGALGQNALGKIQPLAELREHRVDVRILALDDLVQLGGQGADFRARLQQRKRRAEPLPELFELLPQHARKTLAELLEEGRPRCRSPDTSRSGRPQTAWPWLPARRPGRSGRGRRRWARSRWGSSRRRPRRGSDRGSTRSPAGSRRSPARDSRRCSSVRNQLTWKMRGGLAMRRPMVSQCSK